MKIADISVYQGNIDWQKARKELDFVIFRASVGDKKDTKYVSNAKNCGLPFGVYHFYKAGTAAEAVKETEFFYQCARQEGLEPLFYCLDIEYETQTSTTTLPVCEAIAATLRELGARKIGIYIGQTRFGYMKSIKDKFDFIWMPRWGKNTGEADENYAPKFYCDLWQYTSYGQVDGIEGRVDLSKLWGNKDLDWFIKDGLLIEPPLKRSIFYLKGKTIRKNDNNEAVRELQLLLNSFGYLCGRADGLFDANTEQALKSFQKDYNLTVDGICGPKTIQKLIG